MTAGHSDRRPVIRRRGRHTTPSQVEKVAQQAGKAAPAVAIAGALVAAPQASHALAASAKPATVTTQSHTRAAARRARPPAATRHGATLDSLATRTVTVAAANRRGTPRRPEHVLPVRSGDSLSKIAERYYHNADDWQYLYHENDKTVSDPNLIYVGQRLFIPATVARALHAHRLRAEARQAGQPVTQTVSPTSTPAATDSSQPQHRRASASDRRCRRRRQRGPPVGRAGHVQLLGP